MFPAKGRTVSFVSNFHAKGAPNIILSWMLLPSVYGYRGFFPPSTRSFLFLLLRTVARQYWLPAQANRGSLPAITPGSAAEIWHRWLVGEEEINNSSLAFERDTARVERKRRVLAVLSLLVLCLFLLWN